MRINSLRLVDSATLASAGDDGAVKLWHVATLQCVRTLRACPAAAGGFVNSLLVLAGNERQETTIVSACEDATLRLWRTTHAINNSNSNNMEENASADLTLVGHQGAVFPVQLVANFPLADMVFSETTTAR